MEKVERLQRFDEICTALDLMELADDASDTTMVLPSLLKGFDDQVLRLALMAQAGRADEVFSNKLAMSIVASINAYETMFEQEPEKDKYGSLFIDAMTVGATVCTMWGHKAEAIKFLVNIIQANDVFETGIPSTVLPPMTVLLGGLPEVIFREGMKMKSPYQILEKELVDDDD